ncbi:hypothetical protein [Parasediminibacterium sp. JCM 36343]|uniref:hypothetical protein n=1 Tax=Parasediminibacterium sp. JCM 36343 TaxID=3374279 RepID=UPI00397C2825
MVNKKYAVLVALLLTLQVASFAQTSGWDWKDSSVVDPNSTTQFTEFLQNKNPFPPKPRNAWEFSLAGGPSVIFGDVKFGLGLGGSLTLRKAINNTFSYRLGYFGSYNTGKASKNNYASINDLGFGNTPSYYTHDYKNITHSIAIDFLASLNTFSNYRGDPKANIYVLGGLDMIASATQFKNEVTGKYQDLRNFPRRNLLPWTSKTGHEAWFLGYSYGVGLAFKVNTKWNIGVEQRFTAPLLKFDYIDAYHTEGGGSDIYSYSALKINYNL